MKTQTEFPIIAFQSQKKWRDWLTKNHAAFDGVWLRLYKKNTDIKSINHDQALDEALCFGWIDGQAKSYDEQSYLQKFTPRRKGSTWSKRNTAKVEQLIKEGKMHSSGLAEVEKAKIDEHKKQVAIEAEVKAKDLLPGLFGNGMIHVD